MKSLGTIGIELDDGINNYYSNNVFILKKKIDLYCLIITLPFKEYKKLINGIYVFNGLMTVRIRIFAKNDISFFISYLNKYYFRFNEKDKIMHVIYKEVNYIDIFWTCNVYKEYNNEQFRLNSIHIVFHTKDGNNIEITMIFPNSFYELSNIKKLETEEELFSFTYHNNDYVLKKNILNNIDTLKQYGSFKHLFIYYINKYDIISENVKKYLINTINNSNIY